MYISYHDILSRIPTKPIWWLNGVPRYEEYRPDALDIYAHEAALVHTECQSCGTRYDVGIYSGWEARLKNLVEIYGSVDVGDPPNACCSDTSMTSIEIALLEYWYRPVIGSNPSKDDIRDSAQWWRDKSVEGPLANGDWHDEAVQTRKGLFQKVRDDESLLAAWQTASDVTAFAAILNRVGCSRSDQIAKMLFLDRQKAKMRARLTQAAIDLGAR